MSRGIHRHRHIRLATLRLRKRQTRIDNAPRKSAERTRRDERMRLTIKALTPGQDPSPAVKSWVSRQLDKAWRQVTPADLKTLAG